MISAAAARVNPAASLASRGVILECYLGDMHVGAGADAGNG